MDLRQQPVITLPTTAISYFISTHNLNAKVQENWGYKDWTGHIGLNLTAENIKKTHWKTNKISVGTRSSTDVQLRYS
jgi:hypothetical protein